MSTLARRDRREQAAKWSAVSSFASWFWSLLFQGNSFPRALLARAGCTEAERRIEQHQQPCCSDCQRKRNAWFSGFLLSFYEQNKPWALRVKILLKKLFPDVGPIYLVSLKVPESEGLCWAGRSRLFPHLCFTEETGGFKAL